MSKSEWEKRRDAFDYVSVLNGQASVGLHGALGAEARRATEALSRPPPRQKNKATSNIMAGAAASAEASQRVRDLPTWLATVVWIIGFMAMLASTPRRWSTILFASLVLSVPTTAFSDEILARAALLNNEFDMAREIYSDLYDEGNPEAAFVLGMMYREGWGVGEDADRARDYLVEARKLGHIEASYWLCRDQFAVATSRAEYDVVADLCMPASAQDRAKTTGGFIYHPHHVDLAQYVAGKALLKSGSEIRRCSA